MSKSILCPHCGAYLNVSDRIVITAKNDHGKCGLLLLSLHLGDYDIAKNDDFEMEPGEILTMYCPVCEKNLHVPDVHENIYRVLMRDDRGQNHLVFFSGVYGEKCTYRVSDGELEEYGDHAAKYSHFSDLMRAKY